MRKFSLLLIPAVFIVALVFYFSQINNNFENKNILSFHPYAIDSLSNHASSDVKINIEKKTSSSKNFDSYLISYYSENNKLYALMNLPAGVKPNNGWPVIIVNHGYIDPKKYSTINSYINTSAYYANQGFLVLKPDYRGHASSEGNPDPLFSRAQYSIDVLNLINGINSIESADPQRIYMYGHSLGGDVSLMVIENTDKVKAVSLWAPAVTVFPENIIYFSRRHNDGMNSSQNQKILADLLNKFSSSIFSSFSNLSKINTPLIIHHGTTDESVPYAWGEQLNHELKNQNKNIIFHSYPNDNHDLARNFSGILARDVQFFNNY